MKNNLKTYFTIYFACFFVLTQAQTSYVSNGSSTDWGTSTAWTPNGIPDVDNWPYDDVTLNHDITYSSGNLTAVSNVSTKDMITVNSGATLTISGASDLTIGTGDIEVNAGGAIVVGGSLIMSNNAELTIDATGSVTADAVTHSSSPSTITNSGTLTVTTTWTQADNNNLISSGTFSTGGNYTMTGSSGSGVFTGPTTIGGYLDITGSTFSSTDSLNLTGYLRVVSGGDVDLNGVNTIGGTLSATGSGTDFDLNGGSLAVTGNITFSGDGNITVAGDLDAGGNVDITGSGGATISLLGTMDVTAGTLTVDNNGSINGTGVIGWGTLSANPSCSDAIITCDGTATSVDNKTDGGCAGTYGDPVGSPLNLNTCGIGTLPIELLNFSVIANGITNQVFWSTGMELNNDYFEIMGSNNGIDWKVLLLVPGAGNSNSLINYSEIIPSGYSFFKLRQTDYDGTFADSKIIRLDTESAHKPKVTHNPEFIFIKGGSDLIFEIYDVQGRIIKRGLIENDFKVINTNYLTNGIHVIRVGAFSYKIFI